MNANWKLLVQAGLPDGAALGTKGLCIEDAAALRNAVELLAAGDLGPTDVDLLAAWLSAFNHHWPSAFAEMLGEVGEMSLRALVPRAEPNRYLKLRRIAIANLANLV
jgi:hypothetical protein